VLIDYLLGVAVASAWLEHVEGEPLVSAITVAELYAGVREGGERTKLDLFLSAFQIIGIDDSIAKRGGLMQRDYFKSHGLGLADALIAATAEHLGARLTTLNSAHFPMLDDVLVPYTKHRVAMPWRGTPWDETS
jgi:predicted nucleic acid-binding protein